MRVIASVLAAAALATATAQITLPQQWSAVVTSAIAINQGGSMTPQGLCCSPTAPECKIQTAFEGGQMYFDGPNNRTAQIVAPGESIVTLFNDGKQYAVENGACVSYCPLKGENAVMQPFDVASIVGPNATSLGVSTAPNGQSGSEYQSVEKFIIWTMSTSNGWFSTGASPQPIEVQQLISPFGQQIGQESSQYQNFKAGAPPASVFTFTGATTCKLGQCGKKKGGGSGSSSPSSSSPSSSSSVAVEDAEARALSADGTPSFDAEEIFMTLVNNRKIPGFKSRGPLHAVPELK